MAALPVLAQLPPEYAVLESDTAVLALHRQYESSFRSAGYGPDADPASAPSDLAGRKRMVEIQLRGERFVVRRFTHGGLLRGLTGTRFLDPERPFREVLLSHALEQARIPTPMVVGARAKRQRGFGWSLEIVTRRVEGAVDLGLALTRMGEEQNPGHLRTRLLRAAGRFVCRMHDAGFLHADLTPRNLLVEELSIMEGAPRFWAIDLDRSQAYPRLSPDQRVDNLARMLRHALRGDHRRQLGVRTTDLRRFIGGYQPTGRWKELWHRVERRYRSGRWLHGLGGVLDRRRG